MNFEVPYFNTIDAPEIGTEQRWPDKRVLMGFEERSLSDSWLTITGYPSPCFPKVFILKGVKVLCFDTLLEVLILKGVKRRAEWAARKGNQDWLVSRASASGERICGAV
jgi:hypothetical protein